MPNNPTYGTFIGELHRLCKFCSSLNYFIREVKLLIKKTCQPEILERTSPQKALEVSQGRASLS